MTPYLKSPRYEMDRYAPEIEARIPPYSVDRNITLATFIPGASDDKGSSPAELTTRPHLVLVRNICVAGTIAIDTTTSGFVRETISSAAF